MSLTETYLNLTNCYLINLPSLSLKKWNKLIKKLEKNQEKSDKRTEH